MVDMLPDDEGRSVTERLRAFIAASMDLGIPWAKTFAVASVSVNESGAIFCRKKRNPAPFPDTCFHCRPVLILEEGNPNLQGTGVELPRSWQEDPEIMELMASMGWLQTSTTGANLPRATTAFAAFDLPNSPNDNLAMMFEYMIDRRKGPQIGAFSVGPTQVYMRFSPLAGGTLASRFPTWESLWEFYTAKDVAALWESGAWDYLGHLSSNLVACGATGAGCVESYLERYQTGVRDWAGSFGDYARRFKSNMTLVQSLGRELNYPDVNNV